jgi:hypothetical protein
MYHPFPPQNDNAPYPHQDPFQQPSTSQKGNDPSSQSPLRPIGAPLHFTTGQFTGKHVRAELIELQKADLGRKFVRHSCYSRTAILTHPTLLGMLARTADRSTHRLSYNSSFFTRSPAPTDPMQRLTITSCASCPLVSSSWLADSGRVQRSEQYGSHMPC